MEKFVLENEWNCRAFIWCSIYTDLDLYQQG